VKGLPGVEWHPTSTSLEVPGLKGKACKSVLAAEEGEGSLQSVQGGAVAGRATSAASGVRHGSPAKAPAR